MDDFLVRLLWLALLVVLFPVAVVVVCAIYECVSGTFAEWRMRRWFRRALGRDPTPAEVLHIVYGYPMPPGPADAARDDAEDLAKRP